jgi:lipopolysaccharide export system permease protein
MGFVLVFLLVEITDKIKYYFQYNPPGTLMLKYFLVKLPGYLFFAFPLGILLAGMLSLLVMARHSELIAMQANGIDALSIARPVLIVGLTASVLMFLANESIIPWSNRYSEYIQNVEIAGKPDATFLQRDQIWIRSPDSITHVGKFDKTTEALDRITVIRWNADYEFVERLFADKAKWWNNHWMFYGVNRTVRASDGQIAIESLASMIGPLKKTPMDFDRIEMATKEMNMAQLGDFIDRMAEEGHTPARYLVDWHDKIAFPIVCLIMSALSVPFSIKISPRGGGIAAGLALSLVVAFSYWIAHTLFIALGHGGYIPPVAAAWGANVIFALGAAILLLQAGT